MKIIIIGASGTVGRAVAQELNQRHEVIRVGRTQGRLSGRYHLTAERAEPVCEKPVG
ncbi:short chain dehydrogenase [Klebsiella michiganensis]|nr:short chain dehydrogenase [Klebsiella michiganensis]